MTTKIINPARHGSSRLPIDLSAALVIVLLTLLFASAIVAAMMHHPLVDVGQAAFQGGL